MKKGKPLKYKRDIFKKGTLLGNFIKNRRIELGLTQAALLELTEISHSIMAISNIENGKIKYLSGNELKDFAEALKCDEEDLRKLMPERRAAQAKTELGKLIRSRREELGLTIEDLAKKMNLSPNKIKYLETKKNPNIQFKFIKPLAVALNIDCSVFAGYFKTSTKLTTNKLGQFIRSHRQRLAMSMDELSEKLGVSRALISAMELGKIPLSESRELLKKIAEVFEIDYEELKNLKPKRKIMRKTNFPNPLAEFLATKRFELNLSLRKLSQLSGIKIFTISRIELGKGGFRVENINKIANALNCEIPQEIMAYIHSQKKEKLPKQELPRQNKDKSLRKYKERKTALGDFITKRRLELNLNQIQLGCKTDLSYNLISNIERGKYIPSYLMLEKLSKALDCEIPAELIPQPKPRGRKKIEKDELVSFFTVRLPEDILPDVLRIKELTGIHTNPEAIRKAVKILRRLSEKQNDGFTINLRKGDEIIEFEIIL